MVINIIWLLYKMCEWFPPFDQNKRRNVVIDPAQSSDLGCDSEPSMTNIKRGGKTERSHLLQDTSLGLDILTVG